MEKDNIDYKQRMEKLESMHNQENRNFRFNEETLQNKVKNLQNQIEDWREKYSRLEMEAERSRFKDAQISELEEKIRKMNVELERQDGFISTKIEEVNDWREKFHNLEADSRRFEKMQETLRNYEMQVGTLIDEVDNWKSKYMKVENLMSDKESVEVIDRE